MIILELALNTKRSKRESSIPDNIPNEKLTPQLCTNYSNLERSTDQVVKPMYKTGKHKNLCQFHFR